MFRDIEFKGVWFLPANPNDKIVGILKHNPKDGKSVLELFGSFENVSNINEDIILGITKDEIDITLHICHCTKWNGSRIRRDGLQPQTFTASSLYNVQYLLEGVHINNVNEVNFYSISSEITYLSEWVGISGFTNVSTDYAPNFESNISYKLPEPIKFNTGKFNGELQFRASVPSISYYQSSASINQVIRLFLHSETSVSLEDILYALRKFQNFLVLALHTHTHISNIELQSSSFYKEVDGYERAEIGMKKVSLQIPKKITLLIPVRKPVGDVRTKDDFEMLFVYDDIKDDFEKIISKWYEKYELLEPAFNLLFEQFYSKEKIVESSFLSLAQAAETFHDRLNPKSRQLDKDYYENIQVKIQNALTPEEYDDIKRLLNNYLFLDTRLQDIIDRYATEFVITAIEDADYFKRKIKQSRNFYTHYSTKGFNQALKGLDLIVITNNLKLLLISAFLIEVGIPKNKLNSFFEEKGYKMFNLKRKNPLVRTSRPRL